MIYKVYLIGQITADPETYRWREQVEDYFNVRNLVEVINPCNSAFNQNALISSDGDETGFSKKSFAENGVVLLPHRDKEFVKQSNVAFVNMNMYSPEKPIIGTFYELAWYFGSPEKMVIGIFDGDPIKDFQCYHPFVRETVQTWVKSPLEACQLLERFI